MKVYKFLHESSCTLAIAFASSEEEAKKTLRQDMLEETNEEQAAAFGELLEDACCFVFDPEDFKEAYTIAWAF